MTEKESKYYWSEGGQIQYLDGWAWGIDQELRPICLGREDDVKASLTNPKLKLNNPRIDQILGMEREIIGKESESDGRKPNIKRPSAFRSRPVGDIKHREADIRRTSPRKRAAICKA